MRLCNYFLVVMSCLSITSHAAWGFPSMPDSGMQGGAPARIAAPPSHGAAGDLAVARVNGVEITLAALTAMMRQIVIQGGYRKEQLTPTLSAQIRDKAMQRLVVEELAYQRARGLGIAVTGEEVRQQIERMKKEMGSAEHLQAYLLRKGMEEKDLPDHVERFLVVGQAIAREVDSVVRVTPELIDNLYEQTREQYVQPEMVEIADVVFFLDASATADRAEAEKIRILLTGELEGDPTRLPPSPIYAVRQQVKLQQENHPLFYAAAKQLEPGGISPVVEIDATLHLLKLTGYQPYRANSEEEVRPRLEQTLRQELRQKALEQWKEELQRQAEIEILDVTAHEDGGAGDRGQGAEDR